MSRLACWLCIIAATLMAAAVVAPSQAEAQWGYTTYYAPTYQAYYPTYSYYPTTAYYPTTTYYPSYSTYYAPAYYPAYSTYYWCW